MKPIIKRILSIGRNILRGTLKGAFPGVAGAVEAVRNMKGVEVTVTTPGGEVVTGTAKPHNWLSIIPSLIAAGVMIYFWHKGFLTEDQISDLVEALLDLIK